MASRDYVVKFKGEQDPSVKRAAEGTRGEVDKTTEQIEKSTRRGAAVGSLVGNLAAEGLSRLGSGLIDFGGDSLRASSDLKESLNVTQLSFGRLGDGMSGFFADAAQNIGMSESAAREYSAGIGGLLQNMGLAQDESAAWSQKLLTLSADMGSAFNADPAQAIEAIGAGLRGEAEPLRKFNVMLNDAGLKAKAMELGLYDGKGALDDNAKAQAALALITEQTARVQGDFANTSDGAANAQRVAAANVENLQAKIGEGLLPVQERLLGLFNDAIPVVASWGDGLQKAAGWVQENAGVLVPLGTGLGVAVGLLWAFNAAQTVAAGGGLVKFLTTAAKSTSLFTAAQWLANAALWANPIGIVVLALVALGTAFAIAWNKSETFRKTVTGAWEGIKLAARSVGDWFTGTLLPGVRGVWESIGRGFTGLGDTLASWGRTVKDKVTEPIRWVARNVINPLMGGIEKVAGVFGLKWSLPRLNGFAEGGYTGPGGKYKPAGIVHAGEVVWSQDDVAAWGGPSAVDAMRRRRGTGSTSNRTGDLLHGYAAGGIVANARQGFSGYNPDFLARIRAWAAASGRTWHMTGNGGARSFADQLRAWNLYRAGRGPLAANPYRGGPHMIPANAMDLSPRPGQTAAAGLLGRFGLGLPVRGEPWHVGWAGGGRRGGGATTSGGGGGFDPVGMIRDAIGNVAKVTGAGMFGDMLNKIPGAVIDKAVEGVRKFLGFDSGGWMMPGEGAYANRTGKPEAVLTNPQWQDVGRRADAADRTNVELLELTEALWALVRATMKAEDMERIMRELKRPAPQKVEAI